MLTLNSLTRWGQTFTDHNVLFVSVLMLFGIALMTALGAIINQLHSTEHHEIQCSHLKKFNMKRSFIFRPIHVSLLTFNLFYHRSKSTPKSYEQPLGNSFLTLEKIIPYMWLLKIRQIGTSANSREFEYPTFFSTHSWKTTKTSARILRSKPRKRL